MKMMFEVVEVPFSKLDDDFFPQDAWQIALDTPELEVYAKFAYKHMADYWRDGEQRNWDSGYLVVRQCDDN